MVPGREPGPDHARSRFRECLRVSSRLVCGNCGAPAASARYANYPLPAQTPNPCNGEKGPTAAIVDRGARPNSLSRRLKGSDTSARMKQFPDVSLPERSRVLAGFAHAEGDCPTSYAEACRVRWRRRNRLRVRGSRDVRGDHRGAGQTDRARRRALRDS